MALDYLYRDEPYLDAVWVKDSETCIEYLVDLKTGQKLLQKKNGEMINPED